MISILCLAGITWWAIHQEPPELPSSPAQLVAPAGAIGLHALVTALRAERWHALLAHTGARPPRGDSYALTVIGTAADNVLPARAGGAVRVVLLPPRAQTTTRTVIGTLVAERLLDAAWLLALLLVAGHSIVGDSAGDLEVIAVAGAAGVVVAVGGLLFIMHGAGRLGLVCPRFWSMLALRGRHGAAMFALSGVICFVEAAVWMAVGAAVGLGMGVIEGVCLVALSRLCSLMPSGPGYAGTLDGVAIVGAKAAGGSGAIALSYLLVLRFVLVVPITAVGFVLLGARYGGVSTLRSARAAMPAAARAER